jgi:cytosine permease
MEKYGIEQVPPHERTAGARSLVVLWVGFAVIASVFLTGSLATGVGHWFGAVSAIVFGTLIMAVYMGLGAWMGAEQGLPGSVISRTAFGTRGNLFASIPMWIGCFGWVGVQIAILSFAVQGLLSAYVPDVVISIPVLYIVFGILMAVFAVYGYQYVVKFEVVAVSLMVLLMLVIIGVLFAEYGIAAMTRPYTTGIPMAWGAAANLTPAASIALFMAAADTSRYARSRKTALWTCMITSFAAFCVVSILGIFAAIVAGTWDPVQVMANMGLTAIGLPFLILASWTTNTLNIYWGGLALTNITNGKIDRRAATFITALAGIAVAIIGVYSLNGLINFFTIIGTLLGPVTGIMIADYYLIRKRSIVVGALLDAGGQYGYRKGFNPAAIIAWAVGAVVFNVVPDAAIPVLPSILAGSILYYVLTRYTKLAVGGKPNIASDGATADS